MNEEQFKEAILNRLSMKDTQLDVSLKKFVQIERLVTLSSNNSNDYSSYSTASSSSHDDKKIVEEISKLQTSITKELDQYLFQVEKEQLIFSAYQRDCENYKNLFKVKENEIKHVKTEIGELKTRLKNEQQSKRNREEYNTLTKHISKHPKRSETEKAINEVKKELSSVETRAREITNDFESRSKQFQLVLYAINLLQDEISDKKRKRSDQSTTTSSSTTITTVVVDTPTKRARTDDLIKEEVSVPESVDLNVDLNQVDSEQEVEQEHEQETYPEQEVEHVVSVTDSTVTVTEIEDNPNVEVEDVYEIDVEHF